MFKYAVKYLKNTFYPLNVPETIHIEDGQMVLVRTEKGEEALKAFIVNSQIEKLWEHAKSKPEAFHVIRTLSQRDLQTLEDIKKEEVQSFFKCQALVQQHKLNMNLVQCRITFDRRKITFYYTNFSKFAISIAAFAASEPLFPAFVPALSIACSILSVVRTPNITGTSV